MRVAGSKGIYWKLIPLFSTKHKSESVPGFVLRRAFAQRLSCLIPSPAGCPAHVLLVLSFRGKSANAAISLGMAGDNITKDSSVKVTTNY